MNEPNFVTDHSSPINVTWQPVVPIDQLQCPISSEIVQENSREKAQRDENGKLLPGCTGLPGAGRPKGSGLVSDAIKQALREGKAEEVKETLFNLMAAADKDSVRLAAISEIIDRSEGKAIQSIRHAGVFMVAAPSAEAIAALDGWAGDE